MKTTMFIGYTRQLLRKRYETREIAWRTLYNHISRLNSFERFCIETGRDCGEMDMAVVQDYKRWCLSAGNSLPTVNQKLLPLLQGIRQAREEGRMVENDFPAAPRLDHRPKRYGDEAQRLPQAGAEGVRYLTDAQLSALVACFQKTRRKSWKRGLELFIFSFHACGLRISDIVTLEWVHIDFDRCLLSKVLVKTKAPLTIPLSAQAMEILGRWKRRRPNRRFVFDLLPEDFDLTDDAALSKAIDYRNRIIRHSLNGVGRVLALPFPLGMHVARHTFAVKALNSSHVNVHLISHLLGHTTVLVTERVYATFLLPTLSEELREHLSFPEYAV